MTTDLVILLGAAAVFLCGWVARWQWDVHRNWHPSEQDEFDRWDRS